jgi:methyltransferase
VVISLAAYLAILAALAAERIIELLISARHAGRAFARGAVESGASFYRAIPVFHTLFILSCGGEAIIFGREFSPLLGWLALTGAVCAQGLRYWAVAALGEHWTTRIIVRPGAAPVTSGPYRLLRHPNYLAVVIEIICIPMIYGCWRTAIVFSAGNAILLRIRIKTEEAALGANYRDAFSTVPRLIPRLHR